MKLTVAEKESLLSQLKKLMEEDVFLKEDAISLTELMVNALKREQQEMLAEYPWLEPSDKVQ